MAPISPISRFYISKPYLLKFLNARGWQTWLVWIHSEPCSQPLSIQPPDFSVWGTFTLQTWLGSPGRARRREPVWSDQGGRDGVGMKFGSELLHDPCCCGNQGLCSAYHISIHPWEPSLVCGMRRSLTWIPSIGGLCCQGEMQTKTSAMGWKRDNESPLYAGTYSYIPMPCCASQGEEREGMIKIELSFYVHLLTTFSVPSSSSWVSQSACNVPAPFIHCLVSKIILHLIIS